MVKYFDLIFFKKRTGCILRIWADTFIWRFIGFDNPLGGPCNCEFLMTRFKHLWAEQIIWSVDVRNMG